MSVNLFFMKVRGLIIELQVHVYSAKDNCQLKVAKVEAVDMMWCWLTDVWQGTELIKVSGPVFIGAWELWSLVISGTKEVHQKKNRQKDATTACAGEKYEAIGGWWGKKRKFGSDNLLIIKWVEIRIFTWVKGLAMNATLFTSFSGFSNYNVWFN